MLFDDAVSFAKYGIFLLYIYLLTYLHTVIAIFITNIYNFINAIPDFEKYKFPLKQSVKHAVLINVRKSCNFEKEIQHNIHNSLHKTVKKIMKLLVI